MTRLIQLTLVLATVLLARSALGQDFSHVFAKVDPAVVVIVTHEESNTLTGEGLQKKEAQGLGSGIIINREGSILTAAHVVDSADELMVALQDGTILEANVVASLSAPDLALIELVDPPIPLPYVKPADSDKLEIGEQVLVIGAPYGLFHTLSVGHLSGRRISDDNPFGTIELLQTDASINQGNSGGPLFNARGQLMGIVSHIKSQSGGHEGLGFAGSINMAKEMLLDNPPVWLGADFIILNKELAEALNSPSGSGMLVQQVSKGSMAERLGVKPGYIEAEIADSSLLLGGDIITSINGTEVSASKKGLHKMIRNYQRIKPGDKLTLKVIRRGSEIELSATAE